MLSQAAEDGNPARAAARASWRSPTSTLRELAIIISEGTLKARTSVGAFLEAVERRFHVVPDDCERSLNRSQQFSRGLSEGPRGPRDRRDRSRPRLPPGHRRRKDPRLRRSRLRLVTRLTVPSIKGVSHPYGNTRSNPAHRERRWAWTKSSARRPSPAATTPSSST